ncbi:hypothetical protein [Actinomycetospora chiangmaiensis]|uniref:hypothetical protein n=1 Tax=Actinomycetospora chiangmaiensis TaxID=402650 RepID=UPI00037A7276|nr:hypothetical protein [Actinomycetospora chiangmaiensis]
MAVVGLVAVARRSLFDEPCAVLSDDGDVPHLMTVPLSPPELLGLVRLLDPWLGTVTTGREVTVRIARRDGRLHPVVGVVEEHEGLVPSPDAGRAASWVEALSLAHRSRVPIRVDDELFEACRIDPCDIDRVVPLTDRPPLVPTADQRRRLARMFSDITRPS